MVCSQIKYRKSKKSGIIRRIFLVTWNCSKKEQELSIENRRNMVLHSQWFDWILSAYTRRMACLRAKMIKTGIFFAGEWWVRPIMVFKMCSRHSSCRAHFEHAIHMDFSVLLGSNGSPPPQIKKHRLAKARRCFLVHKIF